MTEFKSPFEVPNEMREIAQKSVQQARSAFETFMGNARNAAESLESGAETVQSGALDVTRKTLSFAEANVQAAFDHAAKLAAATSFEEVVKLQSTYMQSQMAHLQRQMQEAGASVQQQMKEAAEAVQKMSRPGA